MADTFETKPIALSEQRELEVSPCDLEPDHVFLGDDTGSLVLHLDLQQAEAVRDELTRVLRYLRESVPCPDRMHATPGSHDAHLTGCGRCDDGTLERHEAQRIEREARRWAV